MQDIDGKGIRYSFIYENEEYIAVYSKENWHINNSYKINNNEDIIAICQALIDIHPIHGKDMISYRTAEDMAYEWLQHNMAYVLLKDDNSLKENAKHVDLNPEDQGKNIKEMFETKVLNNKD